MRTPSLEPPSSHGGLQPFARPLLFLPLYLAVAWISFVYPMRGLNITPWNPQAALAVGLLAVQPGAWPAVWLAAACAEILVGVERMSPAAVVASSAALTLGYAAIAAGLRRWLGPELAIGRRTAIIFLLVVAAGALMASLLRAGALWAVGAVPFSRLPAVVHRASIGDGVGLIVTLPLLLVFASSRHRALTRAMLRSIEWWVIVLVTLFAIVGVFEQDPAQQFKWFYALFLPVVWAATRFGAVGAVCSAGLVQALLIVAVQAPQPLTVFELQLLMAALTCTGLLLGAIVDERQAAEEALRASLRLAAAGDMTAALAHELNQPLTAMSTYSRALQLLARRLGDDAAARSVAEVADKLGSEAARAGDVVNRLRKFFRERTTELQQTRMEDVVREAVQAQAGRAAELGVAISVADDGGLPMVWVDRIQVGVVLRNLISNAIEAASDPQLHADRARSVQVGMEQRDGDLVFTVADTGAGLGADAARQVFEVQGSDKPGGMGIGLAISRAIVETHGGRLWAEPGAGGVFRFTLPLGTGEPHDA